MRAAPADTRRRPSRPSAAPAERLREDVEAAAPRLRAEPRRPRPRRAAGTGCPRRRRPATARSRRAAAARRRCTWSTAAGPATGEVVSGSSTATSSRSESWPRGLAGAQGNHGEPVLGREPCRHVPDRVELLELDAVAVAAAAPDAVDLALGAVDARAAVHAAQLVEARADPGRRPPRCTRRRRSARRRRPPAATRRRRHRPAAWRRSARTARPPPTATNPSARAGRPRRAPDRRVEIAERDRAKRGGAAVAQWPSRGCSMSVAVESTS